jgi:hypothetical protein
MLLGVVQQRHLPMRLAFIGGVYILCCLGALELVLKAFLINVRNCIFVILEWLFWYITEKRSLRIIYMLPANNENLEN